MELLNVIDHPSVRLWLAQSTVVFFIVAGIALLAVGIGLIVNSTGTLRFFGHMNQWVSMRSASKPLEIPRDTRRAVQKYRYWFAAIFVAGGVFALFGLLAQFRGDAVVTLLGLNAINPHLAGWIVDALRWVLVVGNLLAVIAGVMLAFSPHLLVAIEARGSHWYSERKAIKGADKLNLGLDAWVAAHSRLAGGGIVVFALALIGAFALMWPKVW
jgi:hypothetical protein